MPPLMERAMAHYAFTIQVDGVDASGRYEDAFHEAGCDDAMIAVVDGKMFLDFDREAASYEIAVDSAKRNVEEAGGKVVKVAPIVD